MRNLFLTLLLPFTPYNDYYSYPLCQNCHNCITNELKCKLFGNINIISGDINYYSCSVVRKNSTMCGINGNFYTRYKPFIGGQRGTLSPLQNNKQT